ncbi:hypothetical protein KFZ70_05410 [Tamlana fucoidanivorans]|nr:hypothetical protein [Tamlana fucoidanivorans]
MMSFSQRVGIIVQARTSSTRFPEKIIRKFDGDKTFLDILLSRFQALSIEVPIVLATSTNQKDEKLEAYASKYDYPVFFGSEHNVLDRFIECSKKFELDAIIRVCSDNPFLDINLIQELLDNYKGEDYLSFMVGGQPSILTHSGFFSELVSVKALKKVKELGNSQCVEHVTNCIYKSPEQFNIRFIEKKVPEIIRCTLDTENDFENLKDIYFNWYKTAHNINFKYEDLVEFLESQDELLEKMKIEIKNNIK